MINGNSSPNIKKRFSINNKLSVCGSHLLTIDKENNDTRFVKV